MPIEDSLFEQLRATVHRNFAPHRHSALLAAIIAAFAVRPLIGDIGAGSAIFGIALVVLLLVALYNINVDELVGERGRLLAQNRRRRILGWTLATAAAVERVCVIFVRTPMLMLVGSIFWLMFVLFVTLSELRSVLKQKEVTGETICMAVSVYLLLGFTWAFLYAVMFQLHPESFGGLVTGNPGHPIELHALFPDSRVLQPDNPVYHRIWGHHSVDTPSPLRGCRRRNHGPILYGDPGCSTGGNADESIRRSGRRKSRPDF